MNPFKHGRIGRGKVWHLVEDAGGASLPVALCNASGSTWTLADELPSGGRRCTRCERWARILARYGEPVCPVCGQARPGITLAGSSPSTRVPRFRCRSCGKIWLPEKAPNRWIAWARERKQRDGK